MKRPTSDLPFGFRMTRLGLCGSAVNTGDVPRPLDFDSRSTLAARNPREGDGRHPVGTWFTDRILANLQLVRRPLIQHSKQLIQKEILSPPYCHSIASLAAGAFWERRCGSGHSASIPSLIPSVSFEPHPRYRHSRNAALRSSCSKALSMRARPPGMGSRRSIRNSG